MMYITTTATAATGILNITGAGGVTVRGGIYLGAAGTGLRGNNATAATLSCILLKVGTDTWIVI